MYELFLNLFYARDKQHIVEYTRGQINSTVYTDYVIDVVVCVISLQANAKKYFAAFSYCFNEKFKKLQKKLSQSLCFSVQQGIVLRYVLYQGIIWINIFIRRYAIYFGGVCLSVLCAHLSKPIGYNYEPIWLPIGLFLDIYNCSKHILPIKRLEVTSIHCILSILLTS